MRPQPSLIIGFDAKRLYLNRRGLGSYSRTLVSGLLLYAPEVLCRLYTPKKTGLFEAEASRARTVVPSRPSLLWRLFSAGRQAVRDGCRIYHGLSNELPLLPKGAMKSVVTIHDLLFLRFPRRYPLLDRIVYFLKTKSALRRADLVLAISSQTADDITKYFRTPSGKVKIFHQACAERYYTRPRPAELMAARKKFRLPGEFFLYTGAVIPAKNIPLILEALARWGEEAPSLVIAGEGRRHRKDLDRLARRLGIADKLVYTMDTAVLSDSELLCLYNLATALILPSYFEGFGLPVVEAMACGTAVLYARTGGLTEAAGTAGLSFDPENAGDLAVKMKRILSDKKLRSSLIRKGKERTAALHPRKVTKLLVAIYQSLLAPPLL